MLVMHLVSESDGPDVSVIPMGQPFKAAVNDHVMDEKIGESIGHDPESHSLQPVPLIEGTDQDAEKAGDGEDEKEGVVLLKEMFARPVMIGMENPEKSMHDVFVGAPGDAFH